MVEFEPPASTNTKSTRRYRVRRTVVLHDIQEFYVDAAVDDEAAQEMAEQMIAAASSSKLSPPAMVVQTRCEIVDPGECEFWDIEEIK